MWLLALLACPAPVDDPTAEPIASYDPLPYVDPRIGTGGLGAGVGSLNPGAAVPFGMVLAGPESRSASGAAPFYHCSGYYADDDRLSGFGHVHAHGMGVTDLSAIVLMPRTAWDDSYTNEARRAAVFDKADEEASPGRYAVTLEDGTAVTIVATTHGAHHRFGFPDGDEPIVLFDLGHTNGTDAVGEAWLSFDVEAGTAEGFQLLQGSYSGRAGGLKTWFAATFDPAPVSSGAWDDPDAPVAGERAAEGISSGGWLVFPEGTTEVQVRLAISSVDADGAWANLEAELPDLDQDARLAEAEEAWRELLGRVRVSGGTEAERTIFHTALYHSAIWPSVFSDVDGRYRGLDDAIHQADFAYRTNFSMWDTFRTLHPWWILVDPEGHASDMAASLVRMADDGGTMPRWPIGHGYTGGMIGSPGCQVVAESDLKGVTGFDRDAAFDHCLALASGPMDHAGRAGIESYLEYGYVPWGHASGPASQTLEFAWTDLALAAWADAIGRPEADQLREQAQGWKHLWDPDQQFLVAREEDGTFVTEVDPLRWSDAYIEGDAWQYVWGAPQDVDGMIAVQHDGDVDAFLDRMDTFWSETYREEDDFDADSWYWHGNEPDLHYPFLASLAGRPDRGAIPIRHVMQTRYDTTPAGLDGNDDGGTLSAWYLWAATGLYPVAGTTTYAVGSPIFDRVEIDRPDGTLVIRAPGTGPLAPFVAWATLGGEPLDRSVLEHDELIAGGELVLGMRAGAVGWGEE